MCWRPYTHFSSKMLSFCLHFWRLFFYCIQNCDLIVFFIASLYRYNFIFFLSPLFLMRISLICAFPVYNKSVFPGCFQDLSILYVQEFTYDVAPCCFPRIYPVLSLLKYFSYTNLCFPPNLGSWWSLFLKIIFCSVLSSAFGTLGIDHNNASQAS